MNAAEIAKKAQLPRGTYGLADGTERIVAYGSAVKALATAIESSAPSRLYRLADGWRYVGEISADGRFVDHRVEARS